MPSRGRGIHSGLRHQYKLRDTHARRIRIGPEARTPPVSTTENSTVNDQIPRGRTLARSPPVSRSVTPPTEKFASPEPANINLPASSENSSEKVSDFDLSPNFGEISFTTPSNSVVIGTQAFPNLLANRDDFEKFEREFDQFGERSPQPEVNSKDTRTPSPPPRPPTPNNTMTASFETIVKLIPNCDRDLGNLSAFIGTCDDLYLQIREADRPLFCTMMRTRAAECNLYDVIKEVPVGSDWAAIKAALLTETPPPMSRTAAQAQLATLKQTSKESVQEYAKRARGFLRQLNEAGCAEATTEETKRFVRTENERLVRHAFEDGIFSNDLRMYTRLSGKTTLAGTIEQAYENEMRLAPVRPVITCSHCRKTGHDAEHCFAKKNEQKTCNFCKAKGHTESSCRKKQDSKETQKPNNSAIENRNANITCNYCKEKGHYANECPKRNAQPKAVKFAQRVEQHASENLSPEMEYVANRFAAQAQIHSSENYNGQNA